MTPIWLNPVKQEDTFCVNHSLHRAQVKHLVFWHTFNLKKHADQMNEYTNVTSQSQSDDHRLGFLTLSFDTYLGGPRCEIQMPVGFLEVPNENDLVCSLVYSSNRQLNAESSRNVAEIWLSILQHFCHCHAKAGRGSVHSTLSM